MSQIFHYFLHFSLFFLLFSCPRVFKSHVSHPQFSPNPFFLTLFFLPHFPPVYPPFPSQHFFYSFSPLPPHTLPSCLSLFLQDAWKRATEQPVGRWRRWGVGGWSVIKAPFFLAPAAQGGKSTRKLTEFAPRASGRRGEESKERTPAPPPALWPCRVLCCYRKVSENNNINA